MATIVKPDLQFASAPSGTGETPRHGVAPSPVGVAIACVAFLGVFWRDLLIDLPQRWWSDPSYSHGWVIPIGAGLLLWMRRDRLDRASIRTNWWGMAVLAAGGAMRVIGALIYFDWFAQAALVVCLFGLVLMLGGARLAAWAAPAVLFLLFMIPLPYRAEIALQEPLRQVGTTASVYAMQTLGLPALAEGNVIVLDENRIGVAEACSGLRMLVVFFALATFTAVVIDRPLWERAAVVASGAPIAILVNVVRITVTGLLYLLGYHWLAERVFHDLAGWLMPLLAMGLLGFELWLLSKLFVAEDDRPVGVGVAR